MYWAMCRAKRWAEMRCSLVLLGLALLLAAPLAAEELQWIRVADDGTSFVKHPSGEVFVPWGVNYDHDRESRLLEDYWIDEWDTVVEDFQEIKALNANLVRIHLQFAKFMDSPTEPNQQSLAQLDKLVDLAGETGLYLDITGLGCYHKSDVPDWYDAMSEEQRWEAQAMFWSAIAKRYADRPEIFFYNLMNEPIVPGGRKPDTDWLGKSFGDKHFVERITLDVQGRPREQIAKAWIDRLVDAIRQHDQRHLITVGLVHWSLPIPGKLYSGFDPQQVTDNLDLICVHLYPERGEVDAAIETLKAFRVGKPVILEETFPLKAGHEEQWEFMRRSREHVAGWISFYWGQTIDEYQADRSSFQSQWMRLWLTQFKENAAEFQQQPQPAQP